MVLVMLSLPLNHLKYRKFASEAKKSNVTDVLLDSLLREFISLNDDSRQKYALGGGLFKLRIATSNGRGKSAGSRSILAFRENDRLIWLHIFSKNDKGNITENELKKLKTLSKILLELTPDGLQKLISNGELLEVNKDE